MYLLCSHTGCSSRPESPWRFPEGPAQETSPPTGRKRSCLYFSWWHSAPAQGDLFQTGYGQ